MPLESETRQTVIPSHLDEIEQGYGISILFDAEMGSRTIGVNSPQNGWDIHFIYVNDLDWHLSVNAKGDEMEKAFNDNTVFSGWELRKTLQMFRRSTPTLMECLHSPIVYRSDEGLTKRLAELETVVFNPVKAMLHYSSLFMNPNKSYAQSSSSNTNRFIFYLRWVLACRWIDRDLSMPPVSINECVEATVDEDDVRKRTEAIITIKRNGEESGKSAIAPS